MSKRREAMRWSRETFSDAKLGNTQRTERLVKIGADLAAAAGASPLRAARGDDAAIEGAYRFFRNDKVKPAAIAEAGFRATAAQLESIATPVCIEDTTTLSYTHEVSDELGDVGGPEHATSRGFIVHSVLALDGETGNTVGLLQQSYWCREATKRGKAKERRERSYEEKESFKWQEASMRVGERLDPEVRSRAISVCDREADVYEYMVYKQAEQQRFVVRASWDRAVVPREDDDNASHLWAVLDRAPICGHATVAVMQRGGRRGRTAELTVRAAHVRLRRPRRRSAKLPPHLGVNVVMAREEQPPEGVEPLEWILLTSEPIETSEQVQQVLRYYRLRWRIEDFHKAWKTGAGVERRRMQEPDNLQRVAVILAFVAARLLQLRERLETTPEAPCDEVLTATEWKVLWVNVEGKRPPRRAPTVRWAYRALGRLAGWNDSKRTGRMGWESFWLGWRELVNRMEGYRAACLLSRR
jgi:hypothetical protein